MNIFGHGAAIHVIYHFVSYVCHVLQSVFRGHLATSVFLLVIAVGMGVGVTRRKKAVFVDLDGRDWFATKLAKR